ncbi:MAG: hypothetical protein JW754_01485 [Candidatus Aenigmarchaeota archaeon]|nr:hypothetical protein [Candidatus Aenigmarchaeota archaeon]
MIQQKSQEMTPEKAEIIGLLCAEGTHYKYIAKYWGWSRDPNKKRYREQLTEGIHFANMDVKLLERFRYLMNKSYNYSPRITGTSYNLKIQIKKKSVVNDILSHTEIGSLKWTVPESIANSNEKIMAAFIRGLYEGDGTKPMKVSKNVHFLYFNMKNYPSLKLVEKMLNRMGIKTRFWKNNTENMYKLVVYGIADINKFKKFINPRIKRIEIAE